MKLIIITGGSSSGKTSIAEELNKKLNRVSCLSMDDYYYEKYHFNDQDNINWDVPSAYNWLLLKNDLTKLLNNQIIYKQKFLYGPNVYSKKYYEIKPNKYIILEGIFAGYEKKIRNKADYIFFLNSDEKIRYQRRVDRDIKLIKNFNLNNFELEWKNNIQLSFEKYISPLETICISINTNNFTSNFNDIIDIIIKKIGRI